MTCADIRAAARIGHNDVLALNFVRRDPPFVFRAHRRQGLRSHVMEVLDPVAVQRETAGEQRGGLRWFPAATPLKMLRIFRMPLVDLDQAREETGRLRILERYLGSQHLALSQEFYVSYRRAKTWTLLLCGLQEYVAGWDLDPWQAPEAVEPALAASCLSLVERVSAMIAEKGLIPDLAGAGNLLVTPQHAVKLVDINNSSRAGDAGTIPLDDKGYPVWDKSVEALWRIERFWAGRRPDANRPWYTLCRQPQRRSRVKALEARFKAGLAAAEQAPEGLRSLRE